LEDRKLDLKFGGEKKRLDHFLSENLPKYSRSFIQKLIKKGMVLVDGKVVLKTGYSLDGNRELKVTIPAPVQSDIVPEVIPLNIVYEDHNLVIINKDAGIVVHPSIGHDRGTLVNAILAHDPNIRGVGGEVRPGIVHRLDKDTSGLLVMAKNDNTHQDLQQQFKDRTVKKLYMALVDGHPQTPEGKIDAPIGRDPRHRQRMAIVPLKKGRNAFSEFRTIEKFEKFSLLEVNIKTGRTHQIRVHLEFLGCPVVGDTVYGKKNRSLGSKRQLLHAFQLEINLPGKKETSVFQADLPEDFQAALNELRK
jgi:23S rRNA pseudouridine1911/1915/1917 synthase